MTTFNRVRVFIVAGAVLSCLNVLAGVAQNREPSFDVASIRPNKSGDTGSGSKRDPGRVTCRSFSIFPARGTIRGTGTSTAQLADGLANILDRPVLDKSGIKGSFDLQLEYAPLTGGDAGAASAPSIFTALQEQLGLKLETTTAPLEVIVIDRAELPTEN